VSMDVDGLTSIKNQDLLILTIQIIIFVSLLGMNQDNGKIKPLNMVVGNCI
jgi:hypothetical protein